MRSSSAEMEEPAGRTTISATPNQSDLYGRVARRKPVLSKRHMTACLEFAKLHLKDFEENDSIADTIPTVKHGGGSIMLWGCFSAAGTGRLVRNEVRVNAARYREVLEEKLLQSALNLRLWQQFTFQHDYDPKHTAKTMREWLQDKPLTDISVTGL
ncbi:hypothetical protein COCON_G00111600 [Conger conger]|uniref:Transposase Tc1-like domain-containing protein n=1 Tax=Conger conger TaxID=82655 RepID=A0A9Q1DJY0_CONCO|nr:hypothetical protein COCON_G00111600 [Conger conger]